MKLAVIIGCAAVIATAACGRRGPARPTPTVSFCRQLVPVDAVTVRCDQPVTDLTPLAGMTGLEELVIASVVLTDLTPLAALTQLRSLDVAGAKISDVRALHGLQRLERVNLSATAVTRAQVEELIRRVPGCRVLTEVWIAP